MESKEFEWKFFAHPTSGISNTKTLNLHSKITNRVLNRYKDTLIVMKSLVNLVKYIILTEKKLIDKVRRSFKQNTKLG